jgi:hypothetical protein
MRRYAAVIASCLGLFLFLAGCGGSGGDDLKIAYTIGGVRTTMRIGLDEADGLPHGEVYTGYIGAMACGAKCSTSHEPGDLWVMLEIGTDSPGNTTGAVRLGSGLEEGIVIEVTKVDADGGLITGTFSGPTVKDGEFKVRRNDAVGFLD